MTQLIFVVDPMCSWCWGFHPIMEALRTQYARRFAFSLVVGGLRTQGEMAWNANNRAYLQEHWRAVAETTGQPFNASILEKTRFDYDTYPACKAIVTVRELWGEDEAFGYLGRIQEAFYRTGQDTTQLDVLMRYLPNDDTEAFQNFYASQRAEILMRHDFSKARSMGANAFPSVVTIDDEGHMVCKKGYQSLHTIVPF